MGTVIQAGHIFSGGTIVSIPPAGGDSTLYYLVSSHLPSDYAVYLYDSSGNELVRIPKPNDASDSWGNNIGTNDTKIAITDNDGNGALYIYDMDGSNMVKVTSSDASGNDTFGSQLEINSTKIIVGALYAGPIHQQGSVYVYDLDGTNEVKITASDAGGGDRFSTWAGLAVSESKIFVGSSNHDNNRGALYIYDMDGSNEVKVQPSDNAQNDEFGYVVAASKTKVVATSAGSGAHGAAYIFDHDGTNEVKIEPSVDSRNNAFGGASAAINDTHIAIADRSFNRNKGAVYIYNIDGSNEVRIEHPSHFAAYDFFGYNLAMSSSKVFTCPPNDDDGGSSTGNVYEYNLDGTGERTLPTPSTFAAGSRFGQGLYIYDSSLVPSVPSGPTFIAPLSTTTSYLALGDPHYKNSSNQSVGGVYIYNQSDMSAPVTILEGVMYSDSGINYGIHLGSSILLTDTHIIVGNSVNHMEDSIPWNSSGKTPQIMIWSLDDLSSPPTTIFHPDGASAARFGSNEGEMLTMDDKLFVFGHSAGVSDYVIYVYDLTDLSANPIEITPPNLSGWYIGSFGRSFDIDPVSKKLYVGAWSSSIDGASYGTSAYQSGLVLVYDVSDLSSNINTHIAVVPTPSDIGVHGGFGSSIRYHSDKLFIGNIAQAPNDGPRVASLRVYDTSDLSLIQKFDAENSGQYGWGTDFAKWPRSLDVSDNGVVIGAPQASPNEDDYSTGEVFVIPMDSSGNLGTLTKLSNSGLSVADGDRLGEHVSSFGDKIYATHKGSSGNNMKTVEWSWSNLSSNGSELSIVDPRTTFDHSGFYTTGMGVSPVPSLPAFIAPSTAVDSGSIRFDGNSVIKVGSDNSLWNIDTNQAFCMEAFVKLDDVDGGTAYQNIFSTWESSNSYNGFMLHIASGGQIFWIMNGFKNVTTAPVINADNTWYHVAVTRNAGSSIKIFVNGNQVFLGSLTAGTAVNGGAPLYLGANMDGSSSNGQYRPTGNISNYRITIGEQVYSENFTPSTTNLSLTSQGVSESNVKLLAGQSNTDWTQTNQTTSNITLTAQAGSPTSSTINPFPTPPLPTFIVPNDPPVISGIDASYTITTGSDTVITGNATDPEGDVVTWTYVVSSGSLNDTTVSQADNVFTVIPGSVDATFQLSFTATDDKGKVSTHVSDFTYYYVEPVVQAQLWRLYASESPSYAWQGGYLWDISDAGGITLGDGRQLSTSGTSGNAMSATYGQIPVAGKYGIYTSNNSNPFTETTYNGPWDDPGSNMFNGERTSWVSQVGHSILWYLHDSIDHTAMEGGSVNLRTHVGNRPDRCPRETLLQYYTGDLNSTYNSANWSTFATLRSNQTEGSPTWTNITEGSTKTV